MARNNSGEMFTMLRDVIDVLYDGYCKVLNDEELCSTIQKKLKDLDHCSQKEKRYKMLRILNILARVPQSDKNIKNPEAILVTLDQMHGLCQEIIKQLDEN